MTGFQVVGMVLIPIALVLIAVAGEKHREETGVAPPSRKASARIRRNARKKGITGHEAYQDWLTNKQAREGIAPTKDSPSEPARD